MRALLLAAGLGTRLRPLTDEIPKCLVPIQGRPLLGIWLDLLFGGGIERVLVNTHYRAEQVRSFVAGSRWRNRVDLVHEETLLGTGGTARANAGYFGDESALVAHADNLTRFDVRAFLRRHTRRPAGVRITMMTFDTDSPRSCGIVEEDERGVVTAFHEKVAEPPGRRANGAVYVFEPEVFELLLGQEHPVSELSVDVIPHFLKRIQTYHNADYHRDIGSVESLHRAEREYQPSAIRGVPAGSAG